MSNIVGLPCQENVKPVDISPSGTLCQAGQGCAGLLFDAKVFRFIQPALKNFDELFILRKTNENPRKNSS